MFSIFHKHIWVEVNRESGRGFISIPLLCSYNEPTLTIITFKCEEIQAKW